MTKSKKMKKKKTSAPQKNSPGTEMLAGVCLGKSATC